MRQRALWIVMLCSLAMATAQAQILTGSLIGTVRDESGAVLPGVSVTINSPVSRGGPKSFVTNEKGEYRFVQLDPGSYALTVMLTGFSTYQEDGLQVAVSGTVERNLTLKLASVAETITVSAASPMVDPRRVNVTTSLPAQVLETLATKRNTMTEYAKWAPGVSATDPSGDSGTVAVMGSGTGENSILYDGVMANAPASGGNWSSGDMDAVEEVQVVTLGASAEYAVAQGGVFNVVFKSGTNNLRTDALAVWRPDSLVSKPILVDCACSLGQTGFTIISYQDYTGHIGGPIVKNKAWFFAGGNYQSKKVANPGIDSRLPLLRYSPAVFGKVTWQLNDHVKFRQTAQVEPWRNPGTPTPARPFSTSTAIGGHKLMTYSSEVTATLSSTTLLTVRAAGFLDPGDYTEPLSGDTTTPFRLDSSTGIACCGVQSFGKNDLGRHTQSSKLNHYMQGAHVDHNVSFGIQFERAYDRNFSAWPSGVQYSDLNGRPDQASFRAPFVNAGESNQQGVWGEDQMTIGGRLTLSLGFRFDRMHASSPDLPAIDTKLTETGSTVKGLGDLFTWNVWSPRLGFNLKLTSDGKTILRGNYGRAHRPIFFNEFENVHPGNSSTTLARFNTTTNDYTTIVSVTDPIANIRFDNNLRSPFTDMYSIGVDRELRANLGMSATYVHKYGKNQVGWVDIGGVYGTRADVLPDGRTVTDYPLLNATGSRVFLRTNGPGFFNRYNGVLFGLNKRMAHRWQTNVWYTSSKAEGLTTAGTTGQDPNDYVNLAGRLSPQDRPHMFMASGSYEIPTIAVLVGANYQGMSGTPYAPQAQVTLPQGRRTINVGPPDGTYRLDQQQLLHLRFSKILFRKAERRLELIANFQNILQNKANLAVTTQNFFTTTFGLPTQWIEPRQMYFSARVAF